MADSRIVPFYLKYDEDLKYEYERSNSLLCMLAKDANEMANGVDPTRDVRKELLISIWRLQISRQPKSAHFMPSKYSPWLEMQSFS